MGDTYFTVCNLFFCLFVCTVTDFSSAEKGRSVEFCMHVGLLIGQVFSPFGELWLAGSHGGGITSGVIHFGIINQEPSGHYQRVM